MFIVKCLPIVGTAVNTIEAVAAFADGDGKKGVAKLAQAGVGAAMDTAFVMSGGFSSLVTAPLTGSTIEGGKIVGKKLVSEMIVKEAGKITTNVAVRAVTQYVTDNNISIKQSTSGASLGNDMLFRVVGKGTEAVKALHEGDGNKFAWKLAQTATVAAECVTGKSNENNDEDRRGRKRSEYFSPAHIFVSLQFITF